MSNPLLLQDKVLVITGAASGIGRALAVDAARRGAVPAISDVDVTGLEETARLVEQATDRRPHVEKLDVRDRDAWHSYASSVVAELGRADVIVNNAGVALSGDVDKVSEEQFRFLVDVDFWGVVHGTQAFLPHVIASGDGHVVNISSLFGLLSVPGQSAYNAAKFAVRGFTESLRQEMLVAGHPVQVHCVHPGGIKTAIARNAAAAEGVDQQGNADFFDRKLARTSPEKAARVILDGMLAGRPRILVGADARVLDAFVRLTGSGYQRVVARVMRGRMGAVSH
ncbi:SDR family NAD(P)-dependent oxidoreductase [Nocardioides caldifontis]|uniref:SDR family NAD(P)-dependent oxidoreductase n=1 Tax=Nocardioides caldifontis TaxID=2588938 RepID=UPI0011DFF4F6|nr:SDR family NAD(P)-dependent oxidoreductase [Nocardioides caldifontis]